MSKIKSITVTNEVQNKPFSGVKFHVKHKKYDRTGHEINHSNKNIDFNRTKFNKTIVNEKFDFLESKKSDIIPEFIFSKLAGNKSAEADLSKIKKIKPADLTKIGKLKPIERQLLEETILYDCKRIKSGHSSEIKKSIYEYVKGRKGILQKRGVITLGNQDDWPSSYPKTPKEADRLNKIFETYVEDFNHTFGENMLITKAVTNLDEATPHLHYELTMTSKKNGKVSFSLNENVKQARERMTGKPAPKDSRANLKWFREKTDNMMIDSLNRNAEPTFQLKRTGEHTAKDQKVYKEIKEQQKRANCEIIRDYEPNAIITYGKDEQGNEVESDPIKTETGFKAFMNQSLAWLIKVKEKYKKIFKEKIARFEKEKEAVKREQAELDRDRSQFVDLSDKSLSNSLSVDEYRKKLENNQKANSNQKEIRRVQSRRVKIKPVTKKQNQKHGRGPSM